MKNRKGKFLSMLLLVCMMFSMTTVFADNGEVSSNNVEKQQDYKLYFYNFIDGNFITKTIELKYTNNKLAKELVEQFFAEANTPAIIGEQNLSQGISLLDVDVQKEKMIVNLDIEQESSECLIYLTSSLSKTIFDNLSDINEIKILNNGMEIDSSKYEIDFTSSISRPANIDINDTDDIQNIIPDIPNPVIVIDPGHGGIYNHASYGSYLEKNVVLTVAKKLKVLLENRGAIVYLTRDGDYELSRVSDQEDCYARGRVAASNNADMFISLHCNGWDTPDANGVEVYYQDSTYSTSSISKSLAQNIATQVNFLTGMKLRQGGTGIASNNYWVFQTSDTISVLIEAGFITNAYDREYLTVSSKQDILANSIYVGIRKFWWGY